MIWKNREKVRWKCSVNSGGEITYKFESMMIELKVESLSYPTNHSAPIKWYFIIHFNKSFTLPS